MTQLDILQAALDRGEVLTVAIALSTYGVYALSQRIGELKADGYPVDTQMITLANGKRVAQYRRGGVAYG